MLNNHHPDSVTTTLSLAIQQVEQKSPAAADLLRVCAFLHAEAIPEEFFLNAGEALGPALQSLSAAPIVLDAAIKELRRFSLLHRESATKTLHIHRLLQVIIKDRSDGCEQKMWIQRVTQAMLQIFPDPKDVVTFHIENQSDYQRYLSHALICARSLKEWNIASVEVEIFLYRLAKYLKRLGDFVQATDLILQILAISREMFGEEHPRSVPYLNEIAFIYMDARRFYEAEKYFRAALALCEKDSSEAAECFWGLANLFYYQGKYTQAKSFAQQALAIQEQAPGSRQSEIAYSLTVLGRVYFLSREYAQAELLFQKALNMYEETMPEAHLSVASCLKQLCKLYTLQGDWSEATRAGQRALQIYEEIFGSYHPNIANIENALGHLYFCQNRYSEAETSFNRAWMIYEKHPEQDGLDKVLPLLGLGELYIVQNRLSLAQHCLQRVYSMLEQTLQGNSVDHQDIIRCLLVVGDHFALQNDLIQTQACYLQAMNTGVQQFGSDHPLTLQCQSKLEALFVILDQG